MKEIPLTRGLKALVDDSDYADLNQFKWCVLRTPQNDYAMRNAYADGKFNFVLMHNVIMGAKGIDHIDSNGLNNQRCNLRVVTLSQNMANMRSHRGSSSQYKGVFWNKLNNNWRANIMANRVTYRLGSFQSESDAARAYNAKALELFGEFAKLNEVMP